MNEIDRLSEAIKLHLPRQHWYALCDAISGGQWPAVRARLDYHFDNWGPHSWLREGKHHEPIDDQNERLLLVLRYRQLRDAGAALPLKHVGWPERMKLDRLREIIEALEAA